MSNFFRSLFGAKKAAKVTKSRMQTRRLELIGLEERITPATITLSTNTVVITLGATESINDLNTSTATAVITVNTVGSDNNTTALASNTGVTVTNNTVVIDTAVLTGFTGISVVGGSGVNAVTVGATGIDLTAGTTPATAQIVSLDLTTTGGADTLTVSGAIKTKGAGAATLSSPTLSIAAAGDIVTTTGAVGISATTISTAGDVTTTTGLTTYTGAVTLTGAIVNTSTSGGVSFSSTVNGAFGITTTATGAAPVTFGGAVGETAPVGAISFTTVAGTITAAAVTATSFTTSSTSGAVSVGALTTTGAVSITSTGAIGLTGAVTGTTSVNVLAGTTATITGALNSSGAISVVGAGVVTLTGAVGVSPANTGVTVTSTGDNVVISSTVASGNAIAISAATAGKTISLANSVTAGNNSNILLTGDVLSNAATAVDLITTGTGTITITGKVDGVAAANDLTVSTVNGAIIIGGAVGGSTSTPSLATLTVDGATSFLASGAVNVGTLNVGQTTPFATSATFKEAVTIGTALALKTAGNGTVTFDKTITATGAAATINLGSVNGLITVTGVITGKNGVNIATTGSGSITLIGNISTDQTNGNITIESTTGNVVTSGAISTSGVNANIEIDTATSGNVTIGGNLSTTGGGVILLAADNASAATGTGNLTINGTVTTTGAGDIIIGVSGGSVAVNNTVTSGATGNVIFITTAATDAITIASGKNITAGFDVADFGVGILNLGANITAGGTAGIILDNGTTNLTGAVSLKTTGVGSDITLANVNGNQNLTLETPAVSGSAITLSSVGQAIALNTVTVTNSGGVSAGPLTAAKVVLTDTTGAVAFAGFTVITTGLTTAAKAYSVSFAGTSVISGAPVFLNTGTVTFGGTTSLTTGATITGNAASTVTLGGTIVSGGAFNIGVATNTGVVTINDGTQLILNSTTAASNFAKPIAISGATGTLSLLGVGTLTLSGDSASGTSGDNISVINGTLNVTGKLGATSVSTATSGTISGAGGEIGILTVNTGTVAPGGTLKTAAVTLNAATNYSAAVLTATTASNLESALAINLGGAVLSLSGVAAGLAVGNTFTIINNTHASNAITGTFANQAEGSSISAKDTAGNTVSFTVSYIGGTNANDVTLKVASVTTSTPAPTAPAQPMVAGQPALLKFTAVGADAGGGPLVTITFQNGTFVSFFAYASTFTGGVRVALGDVDGNGSTDVITGAGPGGGPQVNVYNVNNATGAVSLQKSFFAFSAPSFTGGIYVAAGDTNADGFDDVIIGAGATGGSRVQVYAGSATGVVTTSTLNDFFAYSPTFTGGVVVAAGQRDAVAGDEVITAPASGGGYNIKSFNVNGKGNSPTLVDNFFAFNNTTAVGGLSLAVGSLNVGSIADLIIGTSNGGYGVIIDSATAGIAGVPFTGFTGAIRAGVAEDANGQDYAVALAGPTGGPVISVFSVGASTLTQTDSLFVMNPAFKGGLFGTPSL